MKIIVTNIFKLTTNSLSIAPFIRKIEESDNVRLFKKQKSGILPIHNNDVRLMKIYHKFSKLSCPKDKTFIPVKIKLNSTSNVLVAALNLQEAVIYLLWSLENLKEDDEECDTLIDYLDEGSIPTKDLDIYQNLIKDILTSSSFDSRQHKHIYQEIFDYAENHICRYEITNLFKETLNSIEPKSIIPSRKNLLYSYFEPLDYYTERNTIKEDYLS